VNKDVIRLGGIASVLVVALVLGAAWYQRSESREDSERIEAQLGEDAGLFERMHSRSLGPRDAPVTIVEFLDPECEACRAMHPVVKHVLALYEGQVRLVLRYMPLHGNSVYAAGALEAAGAQGRFWEMLEVMFEHQPVWGSHHRPQPELIPGYARDLGLDMEAFDRFMQAGHYRELVEQDRQDGLALGVRGTPTFFVNRRRLPQVAPRALQEMIEAELRKSRS
jgi:protein-disulfide isomerase